VKLTLEGELILLEEELARRKSHPDLVLLTVVDALAWILVLVMRRVFRNGG